VDVRWPVIFQWVLCGEQTPGCNWGLTVKRTSGVSDLLAAERHLETNLIPSGGFRAAGG